MTDKGKKKPAVNETSGNGAAASTEKETSARESKYKLWTAIITLVSVIVTFVSVIVGFKYTTIQLLNQGKELQRIEQILRKMPLEGVWDYRVEYTKYFGESDPSRHMDGNAIFLWYGDRDRIGYTVYIGAGVHERGKTEAIVTVVSEHFLDTNSSGIPQKGSYINGKYLARTSSDPRFEPPGDTMIEYKDGEFEGPSAHNIIKMRFTFHTGQTEAKVTFTRPHPQ